MKTPRTVSLPTPFEKEMTDPPFAAYPRPQMVRDSYLCLNGVWDFSLLSSRGEENLGKILVPYPPESRLSSIGRQIDPRKKMIYRRFVTLPDGFRKGKGRILLHFGAVDQYAAVFLNGHLMASHTGGYLPFEVDVTDYLMDGENELRLEADDRLDTDLPYGKQTKKRGGMWYTPVSGIWQTVWMECVPENYIRALRITPTLDSVTVEVEGGVEEKVLTLHGGEDRAEQTFRGEGERITLTLEHPHLWTPEDPYLYHFTLASGEDTVRSYFALRTVGITEVNGADGTCKSVMTLNERPYFFHGLLDQGYFSDGIFLPATEEGFRNDILQMKACGFNMLRKHIKVEPDLFYYLCDKLGMVVFQDMVNSGKYNFLIDTALPTVGLRRGITHRASERRRKLFFECAEGMMEQLYNHPSVCSYTIFNEGWGQFDADAVYDRLKAKDRTRIFDATSGWFKCKKSDVESDHVYFKKVKLQSVRGRPMVLSEFGGYSCKIEGHAFNLDKTYGYRYFDDPQAFEDALVALYESEIVPSIRQGLCATVLTQVSDVEDETNGLLTYDRALLKVDAARMNKLAADLYQAFDKTFCTE
ncbi:MAG: glycoside hydrolase family 2 [Clostridia bacterium]|nr:glycoside hydrolase family 2 [Clostridia bacterium]